MITKKEIEFAVKERLYEHIMPDTVISLDDHLCRDIYEMNENDFDDVIDELSYYIRLIIEDTLDEFAKKLKETSFKLATDDNDEIIYAKNVDVIHDKLLKKY